MHAAVYCRVSTTGQAENGTSLESQRDACITLAGRSGYELRETEVFMEDWSGADLDRPKLERARELIRSSQVQALICYAVDRLARDPIHIGIVAEECAKRGADLLFVVEPLDNSPEGGLIRYVKGYAAQIERERIKERTLRGKRTRAKMGFMVQATGKGMYGYRYVPEEKKRVIFDAEAEIVRRVFAACVEGKSCYSIAVSLNDDGVPAFGGGLWHPLTVKRLLTNSAYKGSTFYGRTKRVSLSGKRYRMEPRAREEWIEMPDVTPALVHEDLFERAQAILSKPKRSGGGSREYLLTGFLQCTCGAPAVGTCLNRTYRYYRCRSTWPTTTRPRTCDQPYINADRLEEAAWKAVREILEQPELIVAEIQSQQDDPSALDQEISRLRSSVRRLADQEKRLIRLFGLGSVTEEYLVRETQSVKRSRETQEAELNELQASKRRSQDLDGLSERVRAYCSQVASRLDEFGLEDKKLALQALQIKVAVDRDGAVLKGAIPQNLATIERTSA